MVPHLADVLRSEEFRSHFVAQCRQDRAALRSAVAGADIDQVLQSALHALEFADAPIDLAQPRLGALLDATHTACAIGRQRQQFANLRQGEAQLLGATDEAQPCHRVKRVVAIARQAPLGLGQQPLALVKPNGVNADASGARDTANGHMRGFRGGLKKGVHVASLNP